MSSILAQLLLLDASQPAGWTLVGAIILAILGMVNRVWDSAAFRQLISQEIGRLKAKDEEQQITIDALKTENKTQAATILSLQTQLASRDLVVTNERRLKMDCREKMSLIGRMVETYRAAHGRHDDDKLDLRALYAFRDDPEVRQP